MNIKYLVIEDSTIVKPNRELSKDQYQINNSEACNKKATIIHHQFTIPIPQKSDSAK